MILEGWRGQLRGPVLYLQAAGMLRGRGRVGPGSGGGLKRDAKGTESSLRGGSKKGTRIADPTGKISWADGKLF